jgi:hypothetical protein
VEKSAVLVRRAVTHDLFDTRTVVPGTIKKANFSTRWQMIHVLLEIPFTHFPLRRSRQSHNLSEPWVQVLGEPFDSGPFTGSIASLENHNYSLTFDLGPLL